VDENAFDINAFDVDAWEFWGEVIAIAGDVFILLRRRLRR